MARDDRHVFPLGLAGGELVLELPHHVLRFPENEQPRYAAIEPMDRKRAAALRHMPHIRFDQLLQCVGLLSARRHGQQVGRLFDDDTKQARHLGEEPAPWVHVAVRRRLRPADEILRVNHRAPFGVSVWVDDLGVVTAVGRELSRHAANFRSRHLRRRREPFG